LGKIPDPANIPDPTNIVTLTGAPAWGGFSSPETTAKLISHRLAEGIRSWRWPGDQTPEQWLAAIYNGFYISA